MFIEISDLFNKLESYWPNCLFNKSFSSMIKDVRFLTKNTKDFKSEILYVIKSSDINDNFQDIENTNIVVINDESMNNLKNFENRLNIIILNSQEDIYEIFNKVRDLFYSPSEIFTPAVNLLNSLIDRKGLKDLIKLGSDILNNPIILLDSSFAVIANSNNKNITDKLWNENIQNGYFPCEFLSESEKFEPFKDSPSNNQIFIVTNDDSPTKILVCTIIINSKLFGYLLLLECEKKLHEDEINLFTSFGNIIGEALKKNNLYRNINALKYENLLFDILEGTITEQNILEKRMKSAKCSFGKNLFVIVLDLSRYKFTEKHISNLKYEIENTLIHSKSIFYDGNLVIILDLKNNSYIPDEVISRLKKFINKNKFPAGLSSRFFNASELKLRYEEGKKTLYLSRLLNTKGTLFFYDDFKFYHLLSLIEDDLLKFCHPSIIKLIQLDEKNSTNYYKTLKCYLENNQNVNGTSEKLFIHRNTLNYRIRKIKEIINMDLKESEAIFQINFTYKILSYLKKVNKHSNLKY